MGLFSCHAHAVFIFLISRLTRMMERTQNLLSRGTHRPNERVHLYDSLLQNVADLGELEQQRVCYFYFGRTLF